MKNRDHKDWCNLVSTQMTVTGMIPSPWLKKGHWNKSGTISSVTGRDLQGQFSIQWNNIQRRNYKEE